jgi:hypothetical protein
MLMQQSHNFVGPYFIDLFMIVVGASGKRGMISSLIIKHPHWRTGSSF